MRLVYFGSGPFGLPTLERLMRRHQIELVISQPDRPAGRKRKPQPTPVARFADDHQLAIVKPEEVNDDEVVESIRSIEAEAFVVIAFGQKLSRPLLENTFAINLHASLLPKFRGAAPINWAVLNNEKQTGISVITLADRMDAGEVLGRASTPIDPHETAGELHDRLAIMGQDVVLDTLERHQAGTLEPQKQDENLATQAPKLSRADGIVNFDQPATEVRARIHGLTPWPGCTVVLEGTSLKLLRVREHETEHAGTSPGEILVDGSVACADGSVQLLSVQPAGGKTMTFAAYCNGHNVTPGMRILGT